MQTWTHRLEDLQKFRQTKGQHQDALGMQEGTMILCGVMCGWQTQELAWLLTCPEHVVFSLPPQMHILWPVTSIPIFMTSAKYFSQTPARWSNPSCVQKTWPGGFCWALTLIQHQPLLSKSLSISGRHHLHSSNGCKDAFFSSHARLQREQIH